MPPSKKSRESEDDKEGESAIEEGAVDNSAVEEVAVEEEPVGEEAVVEEAGGEEAVGGEAEGEEAVAEQAVGETENIPEEPEADVNIEDQDKDGDLQEGEQLEQQEESMDAEDDA